MKLGLKRGEKGFTLVEIIIVLAVMGVLAAVVIPNVSGFLGRGKERSWDADRNILQAAVDSYRTDISKRSGNPWPTLGALIGTPTDSGNGSADTSDGDYTDLGDEDINYEPTDGEDLNSFIDIGALATEGYLKSNKMVKSADTRLNTTANNTISGSYGWYINTTGIVDAIYWNDTNEDSTVDSGEVSSTSEFQTDIYP
jgi:prepilin-type N-terminal cleavage/methylation domain-containing protein